MNVRRVFLAIFCTGIVVGITLWTLQWTVMVTVMEMEMDPSPSPVDNRRHFIQHRPIQLKIMNEHYWGGKAMTCLESCYSLMFPHVKLQCSLIQYGDGDGDGVGDGMGSE